MNFAESTLYARRAFIEVARKGIIVAGARLLTGSMVLIGVMNGGFHDILSGGSPHCSMLCLEQFLRSVGTKDVRGLVPLV